MKRIAAFALIGVMSLSVFVGCTKTRPEEKKPEDTVVTQPEETPDPSDTQQQEDQDVKKVEGIYTGQIDGNSIEVQVGREPMVFWMEDISKAINGLKGKEKVRIEYKEAESGQLRLIKIEKLQ